VLDQLAALQAEHDALAERWIELEELQQQLAGAQQASAQ
jgi:hypothetical protein